MYITRKSQRIEVELLKRCFTSTGYEIYCFRNLSPSAAVNRYIVSVRDVHGVTKDFVNCLSLKQAFMYYLDYICCYA